MNLQHYCILISIVLFIFYVELTQCFALSQKYFVKYDFILNLLERHLSPLGR